MRSFEQRGARVEVWRDLEEVSARAAQLFAETAQACAAASGAFKVALSGGSTPKALYAVLAAGGESATLAPPGERFDGNIPWRQTHVFWSDERCVPPDDERSNYRMADKTLLAHVPIPANQIHRLRGEDEPARAAQDYESVLSAEFGAGVPRFDLILLGMGDDGHTASLFPASPALDDSERLVVANRVEKLCEYRLTLTFRTLNAAAKIIFLVSGESKAHALRAVLADDVNSHALLPARLVAPSNGALLWLVDEAAAKLF